MRLTLLFALCAIAIPALPAEKARQAQQTNEALAEWLQSEPECVISDAERSAFAVLTTDEERFRFIEQFWARCRTLTFGNVVVTAGSVTRPSDGPVELDGDVTVTITRSDGSTVTMRAERMTLEEEQ